MQIKVYKVQETFNYFNFRLITNMKEYIQFNRDEFFIKKLNKILLLFYQHSMNKDLIINIFYIYVKFNNYK